MVKIASVTAEISLICTNVARTNMLPGQNSYDVTTLSQPVKECLSICNFVNSKTEGMLEKLGLTHLRKSLFKKTFKEIKLRIRYQTSKT